MGSWFRVSHAYGAVEYDYSNPSADIQVQVLSGALSAFVGSSTSARQYQPFCGLGNLKCHLLASYSLQSRRLHAVLLSPASAGKGLISLHPTEGKATTSSRDMVVRGLNSSVRNNFRTHKTRRTDSEIRPSLGKLEDSTNMITAAALCMSPSKAEARPRRL